MITITDLTGIEEALVGISGLNRKRGINAERQLSFKVFPIPQNQHSYEMVQTESKIEFDGDVYIIKKVIRGSMGNSHYKEVLAYQGIYGLNDSYKYEVHNGSLTFKAALDFVLSGTEYTYDIVGTYYAKDWENFGDDNRLNLLNRILTRYDNLEFELVDKHITFKPKIGVRSDFQFRYGHNIKTYADETSTANLSTYIKGYGDGIEAEYVSPNAYLFPTEDSPDGLRHAPAFRDETFKHVDSLLEAIQKNIMDVPEVSITIDFVDMRRAGYAYDVPNEGDDVFIFYEPLNVKVEARIVEVDETFNDKLEPIETKVTLANVTQSLTDLITSLKGTQKQVDNLFKGKEKLPYNVLDNAVKIATELIMSASTELKFENGILAIEKTNPNEVVILNSKGLGISQDGGQTVTTAMTGKGIVADVITGGQINANNVSIYGGDSDTYIHIDGRTMDIHGTYNRSWFGNQETVESQITLGDGYLRMSKLNDPEGRRNLYLSNNGLSTYLNGANTDEGYGSGVIEFWSKMYDSDRRGLTMYSNLGSIGLKTESRSIHLDSKQDVNIWASDGVIRLQPRDKGRVGKNHFIFTVKDNNSTSETDGVIQYGSPNVNYATGIRFSKAIEDPYVYITNGNGDFGTGNLDAKVIKARDYFLGSIRAPEENIYAMVDNEFRVTSKSGYNNGSPNYRDLQARHLRSESLRTTGADGTDFYIGVSTGELRVTNNLFWNGGNTGYKAVRASGFIEASSQEYKTDISPWDYDALSVLRNETQLYQYKMISDVQDGLSLYKRGVIVERETPAEFVNGKGVSHYEMINFAIRAIQQLGDKVDDFEYRLNELEGAS